MKLSGLVFFLSLCTVGIILFMRGNICHPFIKAAGARLPYYECGYEPCKIARSLELGI